MKKTVFAGLLALMMGAGVLKAQSNLEPVEGPIHGIQGYMNQAITFQAVVTLDGTDVTVVNLQGESFFLVNGHGLLQSNQITVGDLIYVTKAQGQDFNTSRSNKEKG